MRPTSSRRAAKPTCCRRRPTRRVRSPINTLDEHLDMLMVCHHLDPSHRRGRRVRRVAHPARDDRRRGHPARPRRVLDDVVSDSQAMGRVGEVDHPHLADGAQDEGAARQPRRAIRRRCGHDNCTRQALTSPSTRSIPRSRMASPISVGLGRGRQMRADLVLWKPAFFGVKPTLILKGGTIAAAMMGDPNASIPTPQPVYSRPMFGAHGGAIAHGSLTFVSRARPLAAASATGSGSRRRSRRSAICAHLAQIGHGPQRLSAADRRSIPKRMS